MRTIIFASFLFLFISSQSWAQSAKGDIRDGNKMFKSEKYEDSEVAYRKALDTDIQSIPGNFNLGDALYRQEKYEEAGEQFTSLGLSNSSKEVQSNAFHNLGNSLLQAGKLDESIEAYKDALRRNPNDMDTKYNLAYAMNLKKKQEEKQEDQQNQDNKDKKDNKDQEKNKDKQDQEQNQDQQDQQDNQDQEKQENQQNQEDQKKQEQQQTPKNKISKSDAERMLSALANDEKKTQEKVKVAKAKAKKVRTLKEW